MRDFSDYGVRSKHPGRAWLTLWVEVMSEFRKAPADKLPRAEKRGKKRDSERELQKSADGPLGIE